MDFRLDRRTFLKTMGGAGLASILGGCGEAPVKRLVSHVTPRQELVPGVVDWYASVCRECPAGCGTVVASMGGRPIKIEGNPLHPVNRGALCARGQAALQGLYNPDRPDAPSRRVRDGRRGPVGWDEALETLAAAVRDARGSRAVAVVVPRVTGTLVGLLDDWADAIPGAEIHEFEPVSYAALERANELCFGRACRPIYHIDRADLLISFGADFLDTWLSSVRFTADFARMRAYRDGEMGRFLYVGARQSLTAANADESVPIRPGTYGALVYGILRVIVEEGLRPVPAALAGGAFERLIDGYTPAIVQDITGIAADRVRHLARVIARARRGLALPGGVEMGGTNATQNIVAVNLLNDYLGHYGRTIELPAGAPRTAGSGPAGFARLLDRMRRGRVGVLILYDVNPAYAVSPAAGFAEALDRVDLTVACTERVDETADLADLLLPVHTPLESWGDYVADSGAHGWMQPLLRPSGDSRHLGDILIEVVRRAAPGAELASRRSWHDYLLAAWREVARREAPGAAFETFRDEALRRGGVFHEPEIGPADFLMAGLEAGWSPPEIHAAGGRGIPGVEEATLVVYPTIGQFDGRGADRPWLQELPQPVPQTVWTTVVEIPERLIRSMGLEPGERVRVTSPYGTFECPHTIARHGFEDAAAIGLGQGHRACGRFAAGVGVNPVLLLPFLTDPLSGEAARLSVRVRLERTHEIEPAATPAGHPFDEHRGIAETISLAALRMGMSGEGVAAEERRPSEEIFPPHEHPEHRWGMAIDLNACTGCSACIIACFAENNVPVVGEEIYRQGREMTWIRMERYYDEERPERGVRFLPMLCQQCDNAPCEPVCPVYATYHTHEGLNAQIYNRCVGTRYCANNCPYNVRRFNWFTYPVAERLERQFNPNVTVRTKGVMEKCTFCVQRIALGKDRAKDEGRGVRDGEIIPACAQTCPARAIVFGDLNDPDSEVSRLSRDVRAYRILEEINTKPAIRYLKKIVVEDDIG